MFFLFAQPFAGLEFVEKGIQPLEIALPNSAIPLQPLSKLLERRGAQGINAALGVHANINESSLAEDAKMLRDLRLPETQAMNHVPYGAWPVEQEFDDLKAVGLGERAEGFQHGKYEYASRRIFLSRHILCGEYKLWFPGND
jgi:hypothetical protein